ncbi:peptidoglycan bridge formation glycyltransferase FemA/FemB family protein [candidate division KSB1 bacterium]|nr:peptidoglycan bridge formation glycyltransferase FemA/FemB family protein [candidate division KSB1 bacterium]MBL7093235.1 peptidoglycan bridge formation glycyltransferase FemA/FemB family protein [candidate division KSB1 bacterium]
MVQSKLQYINPIIYKNWDDHIKTLKNTSFFYSSFWAKVLHQSYGYVPMYFAEISKNRLNFLLPLMEIKSRITGNRAVSLPFTDHCDPIIPDKSYFKNFLNDIVVFGENGGWKYLEFRGGSELFRDKNSSLQYYQHLLSLSDEKTLFAGLKSNTKRNIKKAEREGVCVSIDNSSDAMDNFYALNCITRKKHGLPPQPKQFFKNIYENIIKNNYGNILIAKKDNRCLAAAIFFHFSKTVIYKYGASDVKYLHLRANNLVMWEAIKNYALQNFDTFDFGKTEISNEGLRRFKLGWGAEEKMINYYKYDFSVKNFVNEKNKESGWYNYFFKKMPLPILKAAGNMLYKHVG